VKRLHNVIEYLTYEVFRYTCRGLYENHKFLLVLFLTLKKDLQTGHVKHQEFQVFIKGPCSILSSLAVKLAVRKCTALLLLLLLGIQ